MNLLERAKPTLEQRVLGERNEQNEQNEQYDRNERILFNEWNEQLVLTT
jgi:hypothetical protein